MSMEHPLADQARAALPLWGISPLWACVPFSDSENAVFHLVPEQGAEAPLSFVLRLHRPHYHTSQTILSEIQWLLSLQNSGAVAVPRPVPGLDGQYVLSAAPGLRFTATLLEYLPGTCADQGPGNAALYEKIGAVAAKLHLHAAAWTPPAGFTRPHWAFSDCLGPQGRWGDWRTILAAQHRSALPLVERAANMVQARLTGYGKTRYSLIHSDLRAANILENNNSLAVIDFDDASYSWRMFDCAASFSFCEDSPFLGEWVAAWLRGYKAALAPGSPLLPTACDEDMIPCFLLMRRLSLLAWKTTRKNLTQGADPARFAEASIELAHSFLEKRLM